MSFELEQKQLLAWLNSAEQAASDDTFNIGQKDGSEQQSNQSIGLVLATDEATDGSHLPSLDQTYISNGLVSWQDVFATILNTIFERTGFDPFTAIQDDAKFKSFLSLWGTSPFWTVLDNPPIQQADVSFSYLDSLQIISTQSTLLDGIVSLAGYAPVVQNLGQIVKFATQGKVSERLNSRWAQLIISVKNREIRVAVFYTRANLQWNDEAGQYQPAPDQSLTVVEASRTLRFDYCNRHASTVVGFKKLTFEQLKRQFPSSSL